MGVYQLIQTNKSKTIEPSQYKLLYDGIILVKSCTYSEGIKYVQEVMKPGDSYQEKELDASFTPQQTYESFSQNRALSDLFDKGKLH